jgi:hypothetical protein
VLGPIGAGPQHAYSVVVRQDDVLNRLVGDLANAADDILGHDRRSLCVDHHDAVVADDHAGVGIALCGVCVRAFTELDKADSLFGHIGLRRELLLHPILL